MTRIAIIYFSATGITAALAEAFRAGAGEAADARLLRVTGDDIRFGRFDNPATLEAADAADGIAFGSPTFMGGPAAEFKAFADATSDRWSEQRWSNKIAAGFTSGGYANGDQGATLSYFSILAAQHGMIWCTLDIAGEDDGLGRNRLGSQLGVASHAVDGVLPPADLATAAHLGRRLAIMAKRLSNAPDAP